MRLLTVFSQVILCATFGYGITELAHMFDSNLSDGDEQNIRTIRLNTALMQSFDKDKSKDIDRAEFLSGVLISCGALEADDLDRVNKEFDKLSKGREKLSYDAANDVMISCVYGAPRAVTVYEKKKGV